MVAEFLDWRTLLLSAPASKWFLAALSQDSVWRKVAATLRFTIPAPAAGGSRRAQGYYKAAVLQELSVRREEVMSQLRHAETRLHQTTDRIQRRMDALPPFAVEMAQETEEAAPRLRELIRRANDILSSTETLLREVDQQRAKLNRAVNDCRVTANACQAETKSNVGSTEKAAEGYQRSLKFMQLERAIAQMILAPETSMSVVLRRGVDSLPAVRTLCLHLPPGSQVPARLAKVEQAIPLDDDYFAVRDELLRGISAPAARTGPGSPTAQRRDIVRRILLGLLDDANSPTKLREFFRL